MKEKIEKILNNLNEEISNFNGEDLFKAGLMDSLQIMKLVVMLENEFNIEIDIEYINANNFKNINNICKLMEMVIDRRVVG